MDSHFRSAEHAAPRADTQLVDASAIAKPAVVCAESGSDREALRIAMDLDELLSEAATLHGAMCLLGRLERAGSLPG